LIWTVITPNQEYCLFRSRILLAALQTNCHNSGKVCYCCSLQSSLHYEIGIVLVHTRIWM